MINKLFGFLFILFISTHSPSFTEEINLPSKQKKNEYYYCFKNHKISFKGGGYIELSNGIILKKGVVA